MNQINAAKILAKTKEKAGSISGSFRFGFSDKSKINILDHSPFKFYHGINPKRLLKGRCSLAKNNLYQNLMCSFCLNVIVQGAECPSCEQNFCQPCFEAWQQSTSAKFFNTPCKCDGDETLIGLKQLNKLKVDYLSQVRFKCNNFSCSYQLTYDELILGTHELDDCMFMKIVCEGCGVKIHKSD